MGGKISLQNPRLATKCAKVPLFVNENFEDRSGGTLPPGWDYHTRGQPSSQVENGKLPLKIGANLIVF
jgi:hypothetical protein